jgi:hypothetical protein
MHDRRRGRRAVIKSLMNRLRSHEDCFPKILFAHSRCRIVEDDSFGDLLSQLLVHSGDRDEGLGGVAAEEVKT